MNSETLDQPGHRTHGTFVLPEIHSEIPSSFGKDFIRKQALARFALATEQIGIPLPGGDFTSIEKILARQWQHYLGETLNEHAKTHLKVLPEIIATDASLEVIMTARSELNTYRLKPIVEKLEKIVPGLGWYVQETISRVRAHGIEIYDSLLMAYALEYNYEGAETDEEYVRLLMENEGEESEDQEITDEVMARYKESYSWFPSDILKELDGHRRLLGWMPLKGTGEVRTRTLSRRQAINALRNRRLKGKLRECVNDAIHLDRLLAADKKSDFHWHEIDDADLIGAACFIAWDRPNLLWEQIEHHETNLYNGGMAYEALGKASISIDADAAEIKKLAREMRAYFERWNALGKLLSHFPNHEEDEDES